MTAPRRRADGWLRLAALVLLAGSYIVFRSSGSAVTELPFSDFLQRAQAGDVASVTIGAEALDVTLRDGTRFRSVAPPGYVGANAAFVRGELVI